MRSDDNDNTGGGDHFFFFDGHVNTSLVENETGMHRLMKHTVRIGNFTSSTTMNEEEGSSSSTTGITDDSTSWTVRLYLLFNLPSDLFINPEDAFETVATIVTSSSSSSDNWNVTLKTTTKTNVDKGGEGGRIMNNNVLDQEFVIPHINQEEPSFASSPHDDLYIVVDGAGSFINGLSISQQQEQSDIRIDFATKLHVRYPRPHQQQQQPQGNRDIHFMPPSLVGGKFQQQQQQQQQFVTTTEDKNDITTTKTETTRTTSYQLSSSSSSLSSTSPVSSSQKQYPPLVVLDGVPAGYAIDEIPVICISIIVTILGAILIVKSISSRLNNNNMA